MISASVLRTLFVYNPETGLLRWNYRLARATKIGQVAGCHHWRGYWQVRIYGKSFLAHRVIWAYVTGAWPRDQIDHVNGVKSDNRWGNLRQATQSQNEFNTPLQKNNTSGRKWVFQRGAKGKWIFAVYRDGGVIRKTGFETRDEAYAAALAVASQSHGEFIRAE